MPKAQKKTQQIKAMLFVCTLWIIDSKIHRASYLALFVGYKKLFLNKDDPQQHNHKFKL